MTATSFVISQAEFDTFHGAGIADAVHAASMDAVLAPVLATMSGSTNPVDLERWNALREAFIGGAVHEGIEPESAGRRWTRLIQTLGFDKPQSAKARALQVARRLDRANDAKPKAATPKAGAGSTAAKAAKLELNAMEAHIIAMIRAGKFTQVHDALRDMETAAK